MTKEQITNELEQLKQERFRQCDLLNHLNGQIAYAEHVLSVWDTTKTPEKPVPPVKKRG